MNKKRTILVADGDKTFVSQVKTFFEDQYKVISVLDAQGAIDQVIKSNIDILLLDLILEDKNGMYAIETIRSFNNDIPIIVCSQRANVENIVMALNTGANDYMVKPLNIYELEARIKNQFRYLKTHDLHILTNGPLTLDFDAKTIYVNGVEVRLTNFEYKIVCLLSLNIGKTLSHEYIINYVWGPQGQDPNGLRVFMAGIRKKLTRDEKSSNLIRTDIGRGYRMNQID